MVFLDAKEFGNLLKKKRIEYGITQEQLAEGIYNITTISKIEKGELLPEKSIRDRLLERLGENSYCYENYVTAKEYKKWKAELLLLDALDFENLSEAEQQLVQYEKRYKKENKVTYQLYLVLLMQLWKQKNSFQEDSVKVLEQAVKLTIPKIDTKAISDLVVSVAELNLVLEYVTYKNPDNLKELYQQLIQYIKQKRFDLESQALFCSKVCLYFCNYQWNLLNRCKDKMQTIILAEELLEVATQGIESLRNHEKIYFAWELLQIKQQILDFLLAESFLVERKERYQKEQEQTKDFFEVIDKLYDTYHIPKQTNLYTIFYRKREVYCINDVIRARRKMFGVRMQDLEDICGVKTMYRIEKKTSKIQIALAQQLFQRFYLSMEMQRASIVTSNEQAIWLEEKFRFILNQKKYEEAMQVLQKLKQMVSMEELINKQYIEYYEQAYLVYKIKNISKEQFIKRAIEILEYTMSIEIALQPLGSISFANGRKQQLEKYFTNQEIRILYNIAQELEGGEKEKYFFILQKYMEYLEQEVTISPILGVYGLVMSAIASYMGNRGEYEASSIINKKIIKQSLKIRHLEYVEKNVYSLMWNEEKKQGLPEKENLERILCMKDCIRIANYNKDQLREDWMRTRLKGVLED